MESKLSKTEAEALQKKLQNFMTYDKDGAVVFIDNGEEHIAENIPPRLMEAIEVIASIAFREIQVARGEYKEYEAPYIREAINKFLK